MHDAQLLDATWMPAAACSLPAHSHNMHTLCTSGPRCSTAGTYYLQSYGSNTGRANLVGTEVKYDQLMVTLTVTSGTATATTLPTTLANIARPGGCLGVWMCFANCNGCTVLACTHDLVPRRSLVS